MQPEHAHKDMNYAIQNTQRVSLEPHVKEIALKALEKIPGAKQAIEETFHKGEWKMPFALPSKRHEDLPMHLGWN